MSTPAADTTVLELYKLSVEMADRTSARRLATNTFFVTLQSALVALVAIFASANGKPRPQLDKTSLTALAGVGIVVALTWWLLLRYYRRLNAAKFAVINAMESDFPARPFSDEWEVLHPSASSPTPPTPLHWYQLSRRARRQEHREASLVEQLVPILFAALYLLLGIKALAS